MKLSVDCIRFIENIHVIDVILIMYTRMQSFVNMDVISMFTNDSYAVRVICGGDYARLPVCADLTVCCSTCVRITIFLWPLL